MQKNPSQHELFENQSQIKSNKKWIILLQSHNVAMLNGYERIPSQSDVRERIPNILYFIHDTKRRTCSQRSISGFHPVARCFCPGRHVVRNPLSLPHNLLSLKRSSDVWESVSPPRVEGPKPTMIYLWIDCKTTPLQKNVFKITRKPNPPQTKVFEK